MPVISFNQAFTNPVHGYDGFVKCTWRYGNTKTHSKYQFFCIKIILICQCVHLFLPFTWTPPLLINRVVNPGFFMFGFTEDDL